MNKDSGGFSLIIGILAVLVVAVLAGTGWYVAQKSSDKANESSNSTSPLAQTQLDPATREVTFANPKKGAHFETSTPAHGSTLAAAPNEVVIDFNFDLADNSTITINKDGNDYGIGSTTVDVNKLALRRKIAPDAPDGLYTVNYNGCWPDRSCHDGSFQFSVNRRLLQTYQDKRGQKAVTIKMSDIKFKPAEIRISKGTTVTWVNDDNETHYVNTDSHPAHSHVPGLNSKSLAKGASYSFTFSEPGAYPYHCSAHADQMRGIIITEK